jgi:hypothetical protein
MNPKTVTGYEPRFDFDIRRGKVGEEYVGNILGKIANGSVEVKTDYGSNKTGNVYVEFEQQLQNGKWVPSGIATTKAEFWAFAFKNGAVFVETETLRALCKAYMAESRVVKRYGQEFPECVGHRAPNSKSNGSRGVKLPVAMLTGALKNFG